MAKTTTVSNTKDKKERDKVEDKSKLDIEKIEITEYIHKDFVLRIVNNEINIFIKRNNIESKSSKKYPVTEKGITEALKSIKEITDLKKGSDELKELTFILFNLKVESSTENQSEQEKLRNELSILLKERIDETEEILKKNLYNISDTVGSDYVKDSLERCITVFVKNKENLIKHKKRPDCGKLVVGIPGTDKTHICISIVVNLISNKKYEGKYRLIIMSVSDFTGPKNELGKSDVRIHVLFKLMREYNEKNNTNIIIYVDECQPLLKDRGSTTSNNVEERTNGIFKELGGVHDNDHTILFIGSMNDPSGVDANFLSHGRFGLPLVVNIPTAKDRLTILINLTKDCIHFKEDVKLNDVSNFLTVYTGRDLMAFTRELQTIYDDRVDSGKYNPHPYISITDIMKLLVRTDFINTNSSNLIKLNELSRSLTALGIMPHTEKSDEELIKELKDETQKNIDEGTTVEKEIKKIKDEKDKDLHPLSSYIETIEKEQELKEQKLIEKESMKDIINIANHI